MSVRWTDIGISQSKAKRFIYRKNRSCDVLVLLTASMNITLLAWVFVAFNNMKFSFLALFSKSEVQTINKYLNIFYALYTNSKKSILSSKHPDPLGKQC